MTDSRFTVRRSGKLQCTICGATGWPGTSSMNKWEKRCSGPHDFACDKCPKRYPTAMGLAGHKRKTSVHD